MSLVGKDYNKDSQILKAIEDAMNLKISPGEAEIIINMRLDKYFPSFKVSTIGQCFEKVSALEHLTEGFYSPGRGMATPLCERYAFAHDLSGRLTSKTALRQISNNSGSGYENSPERGRYGNAAKGISERTKEPF
jgi:hypothetical protein